MSARRMFEALSAALAEAQPSREGCNRVLDNWQGWHMAMTAVAHALEQNNRAFDKARFIQDCIGDAPPVTKRGWGSI